MAGGGGGDSRTLEQTPTWAVAAVCAVILLISILLEKGLHHVGEWFTKRKKMSMFEALEKVKAELMILGFISLLLTFGQSYIAKICIPDHVADTMLPCKAANVKTNKKFSKRFLFDELFVNGVRRSLAGADSTASCSKGKVSLVSTNAIHQLHIFIFFLAVFHVIFSAVVMALGRAKIRRWKEWEKETQSLNYESSHDPTRFRFAHDTSFVRAHSSFWNKIPFIFHIVCFFRQFFRSVRKADYLTMRHGFIAVHLAPGSKFDFQKYIKRSLEDDFKEVVGISPVLWASAVIFLLLNVNGWYALFWVTLIPLVIILAVGTKLQAIITNMALEIQERHAVVQGMPLVQLNDKHFWFGSPKLVLFLIHFTLFQNAFQIVYFLWIWYEFGLKSCFHENFRLIIARVATGVGVQFLCSYITLPLYALVTQMGSHMKRSIFDEQTSKALKKWHQAAKKRQGRSSLSRSNGVSPAASPFHPLHRFKTVGHSARSAPSGAGYYSDGDLSEVEPDASPRESLVTVLIPKDERHDSAEASSTEVITHHQVHPVDEHVIEDDFSFPRP
ncbi:MLO-like protein 9 [Amborella trichopoda]|uniref:MLO-like protein n=1 Tax=Amborella trichopoda TaxID=13333 RepID=U5D6V1_AMBTC|nr:MLO-like protein 9 [Amborella trichopoda]ERN17137.1 hypothetical protein AMTR_s00044p00123510 [Amborella trichopoda]|eukprot:XP_006855670.1 MLO-like protein 9 [Amborella trichopoda]